MTDRPAMTQTAAPLPSLRQFAVLVGQRFLITPDGAEPLPATLAEATALPSAVSAGREGFSLLFDVATEQVLPQGIYPLAHPALDALAMFIVPVARIPGGVRYEAIFN
jgi:hypothetical protein